MGCVPPRTVKSTAQASFEFVAAPWPRNERQIKAKNYYLPSVIPGRFNGRSPLVSNPESRDSGSTRRRVSRNDGSGFQRLVDFGPEHALEILRRHRADH